MLALRVSNISINAAKRHYTLPHISELPGNGGAQVAEGCGCFLARSAERLGGLFVSVKRTHKD